MINIVASANECLSNECLSFTCRQHIIQRDADARIKRTNMLSSRRCVTQDEDALHVAEDEGALHTARWVAEDEDALHTTKMPCTRHESCAT